MKEQWKEQLLNEPFLDCKDILKNKKVVILSCGPSIEKYKNLITYDNIIVTIKTATGYSNGKEDFFFYDERMFSHNRKKFKYNLNNDSIKVFCKNHIKNENVNYDFPFNPDIEFCVYNKIEPFNINSNNFKFYKSNRKNKYYYNCHLFFPIILKAMMFFINLGVKSFDIFGWNWFNEDNTPHVKHFMINYFKKKNKTKKTIGFDNLMGSFYSNIFLKDIIEKFDLDLKLFSEYSQVDLSVPRVNLENEIFFQKSNFYNDCLNNILNDQKKNNNYFRILNLCRNSKYYDKIWYKTIILMVSLLKNYNYEKLTLKWENNIDKNKKTIKFGDCLYSVGCTIAM